jgi:hypothetical protein
MRSLLLTALLLFLPVVALAQVEVNGKGEPVALQNAQWQRGENFHAIWSR